MYIVIWGQKINKYIISCRIKHTIFLKTYNIDYIDMLYYAHIDNFNLKMNDCIVLNIVFINQTEWMKVLLILPVAAGWKIHCFDCLLNFFS